MARLRTAPSPVDRVVRRPDARPIPAVSRGGESAVGNRRVPVRGETVLGVRAPRNHRRPTDLPNQCARRRRCRKEMVRAQADGIDWGLQRGIPRRLSTHGRSDAAPRDDVSGRTVGTAAFMRSLTTLRTPTTPETRLWRRRSIGPWSYVNRALPMARSSSGDRIGGVALARTIADTAYLGPCVSLRRAYGKAKKVLRACADKSGGRSRRRRATAQSRRRGRPTSRRLRQRRLQRRVSCGRSP